MSVRRLFLLSLSVCVHVRVSISECMRVCVCVTIWVNTLGVCPHLLPFETLCLVCCRICRIWVGPWAVGDPSVSTSQLPTSGWNYRCMHFYICPSLVWGFKLALAGQALYPGYHWHSPHEAIFNDLLDWKSWFLLCSSPSEELCKQPISGCG